MNNQRILAVAHGYFLLTGYQIRSFDSGTRHYHLNAFAAFYFLMLSVWYLICFGHHFEESAFMKIVLDLSPFLKNLVILQIWLGLKAFVFCIIEWRSLTAVINGLADIVITNKDSEQRQGVTKHELLTYCMLFTTLVVAFLIGLYIAIELKFELPPMDHIMIAVALSLPHLILSGSLRLYNLCLWLLRQELHSLKLSLYAKLQPGADVVIEVVDPDFTSASSKQSTFTNVCSHTLNVLEKISIYLKSTNAILQRQLCILNALNFNCLLYGVYTRLYFDKTWHVIFFDSKCRAFYAANTAIFVCIYLDYIALLLVQLSFKRTKHDFIKFIASPIKGLMSHTTDGDTWAILQKIKMILKDKLNFKLFGLMDFTVYNFVLVQVLMLLLIAVIVLYQYFSDQIVALAEQMESSDDTD